MAQAAAGGPIVVALLSGLLVWYFVGAALNRRRVRRWLRTLADALSGVTPRPSIDQRGVSAFQIVAVNPSAPIARLTLIAMLAPREIPLVWLAARLRGQQDLIVVRADLDRAPRHELDVCDPATPTGRRARRASAAARWSSVTSNASRELEWRYPPTATDPRDRWSPVLERLPFRVIYLSLRREAPHLHVTVVPSSEFSGRALLDGVVELANRAVQGAARPD